MNNSEEPTITVADGSGLTGTVYIARSYFDDVTVAASTNLPIHVFHHGEFTYMVVGPEVMKMCERTLPETEVADIVDLLSWEQIERFQDNGLRQDMIEWCLDNNIYLIPQWRRVSLVTERAERNIARTIDDSCRAALSAITMSFHKSRVKLNVLYWYIPKGAIDGSSDRGVNLHPYQQTVIDSLMRQRTSIQEVDRISRMHRRGGEPPSLPLIVKADSGRLRELLDQKSSVLQQMRDEGEQRKTE